MGRFCTNAAGSSSRGLLWLLACVAASSCAQPAQPTAPASAPPAAVPEAVVAAFKRADTNGDGLLTRDEAAFLPAIYAQFDEIDLDHDGMLSFNEFSAWLAKKPE